MKRFAMTIALTCVLVGTALAGDIPSVPAPPPPIAAQLKLKATWELVALQRRSLTGSSWRSSNFSQDSFAS